MTAPASDISITAPVITPEQLLEHWQGHRRLTRRVIDAFPDDQLFSFTVGSMRSFGVMALEMLHMAVPTLKGVITEAWDSSSNRDALPKAELLRLWNESTEEINNLWPQIPVERFQETMTAFGQWTMPVYDLFFYLIDNEIHHRGQGYVYLRALEIEPPFFPDRS